MALDFALDTTGDLVIENGSISIASGREADAQLAYFVIQTAIGGFLIHPTLGVHRDFHGMEMSPGLLGLLRQEVLSALVRTGGFSPDQLTAEVVVIDTKTILIIMEVKKNYKDGEVLRIVFTFNPNFGTITNVLGETD